MFYLILFENIYYYKQYSSFIVVTFNQTWLFNVEQISLSTLFVRSVVSFAYYFYAHFLHALFFSDAKQYERVEAKRRKI